jgi:hypothetical protein
LDKIKQIGCYFIKKGLNLTSQNYKLEFDLSNKTSEIPDIIKKNIKMRKIIFILLSLVFVIANGIGQDELCTPDSSYADKKANLYPEAFHPRTNPDGGILDTACINHDYSFVFTAVVPDSFETGFGNVKLDSIAIEKDGFLYGPKGMEYKCNPPNCNFVSGTLGCIELYGKPEPDNEIKVYDLQIKVKITALDGIVVINDTLPQYITDSAHYFLPLMAENSPYCQSLGVYDLYKGYNIDILINPIVDQLSFEANVSDFGKMQMSLTDLQGREVFSGVQTVRQGYNFIKIDVSSITPGIYFLNTSFKGNRIIRKIIISDYK